ncbi:hypothetical protein UFOVP193_12 [uncultured Caudovirales phage]|uniref:Uncharacterized protein n=1 Tax=uncultured Caudovirales phage TaxID=2100421 RepID=A0A6J7WGN6_9CAUD|nr:hypothetical protein UFOVP193_12 [uncultured Caudovirales phage]
MAETHFIPFFGVYEEKDGSLTINVKENMENEKLAISSKSTFKYSSGADVQKLWKAYGWIPPSTVRNDYLFKANRIASGLSK